MNATERAKTAALAALRLPDFAYGAYLIRNLRWRVAHNAAAPLSSKEKWLLDLACWRYRNKLGGVVSFALPDSEPQQRDYLAAHPKLKPQERLL